MQPTPFELESTQSVPTDQIKKDTERPTLQQQSTQAAVNQKVEATTNLLPFEQIQQRYWQQNEMVVLPSFIDRELTAAIGAEVERLEPQVHRSYVPGYKRSGSIDHYTLTDEAPMISALYGTPALRELIGRLAGEQLSLCPANDPHASALYYYTKPGDRVGFHYDTSFYKGKRFTVLVGLVHDTTSRLLCDLHRDDPEKETKRLEVAIEPGSVVVFNGDKLYHAVSPLGENERRIVLTLEYVTDQHMGKFRRVISHLKDSIAYFGISSLFRRRTT